MPEKKKAGRPTDNSKGASIHIRLDELRNIIPQKYYEQEYVRRGEATLRGIRKLVEDLATR